MEDLEEIKRLYFTKALEGIEDDLKSREEIVESFISNQFVTDNVNARVEEYETLGDEISQIVSEFFR